MNNYTHHHAALYHCSLAIAAVAMAITMNSCQDYEYGFTEEEIHQTAIERDYKKEFKKQFPSIDPEHTWMCEPDTVYEEVMVNTMTRAGELPTVPTINTTPTVFTEMSYTEVQGALGYMKEAEDNRGKAPRDFEYKAIEDSKGEGYEEYTITPTFWGRKFCDDNQVGIYYIDGSGKHDMGIFWNDKQNHIYPVFKDGYKPANYLKASDQQIIDDPDKSNYELSIPLTHTCSKCNGGSKKVNTWIRVNIKENNKNNITDNPGQVSGEVNHMPNCYRVNAIQSGQSWDSQFFVVNNNGFKAGDTYRFHIWAKTVSATSVNIGAQLQTGSNGDISAHNLTGCTITNKWTEFVWEGTIPNNKTVNSFVLNLSQSDKAVTYYFSDITWEKNPCPDCIGGKSPVDHYELPQYTLKVPVGMKWGVYLTTKKQQTDNSAKITWYSNSDYNEKNQSSDTKVQAAATFTYNGTTYVSFEDAPTECTNHNGTGNCPDCGRGHYDKDYNDIVLTITPRPVTSTYRSVKYRVMCEDLGGTFDWDFNDVVYDVVYKDGKTTGEKATVEIILQAVGGTLPIYMYYDNQELKKNNNGPSELHEWSTNQQKNNNGLYTPVNVTNCKDVRKCDPVTLKTFTLEKQIYSANELDICNYAKKIVIRAQQKAGLSSTVKFPLEKGDAIPQCFMTGIGTEWAGELQNITGKYPNFSSWVKNHQNNDWTHESY